MEDNKIYQLFEDLKAVINAAQEDVNKFSSGVAVAGTRTRKAMQSIKAMAQDIRNEISAQKNA